MTIPKKWKNMKRPISWCYNDDRDARRRWGEMAPCHSWTFPVSRGSRLEPRTTAMLLRLLMPGDICGTTTSHAYNGCRNLFFPDGLTLNVLSPPSSARSFTFQQFSLLMEEQEHLQVNPLQKTTSRVPDESPRLPTLPPPPPVPTDTSKWGNVRGVSGHSEGTAGMRRRL